MKISIVVPVYNEERLIKSCLDSLIKQDYPKEDYEIVVVNDGSSDGSRGSIREKEVEARSLGIDFNSISLEKNQGWILAREAGAKIAKHGQILFIDSRCVADRDILRKLKEADYQPIVGNPIIDPGRSIFDRFGFLFRKKLYRGYFGKNFKPIFITPQNYDQMPKSTTVFFCDRDLFLSSQPSVKSRLVSDDIRLLKNIVQKKDILKHPDVKVTYLSRDSFGSEFKHIFHRGPRFIDYYLNPKKIYFWLFILPSILIFPAAIFIGLEPARIINFIMVSAAIDLIAAIWLSRNVKDIFVSIILMPFFALSFWIAIIRGLALKGIWGLKNIQSKILENRKMILMAIFLASLAFGFFWNQKMFGQPISSDQNIYDGIAQSILEGKGFTLNGSDAGMEPLYPLFLSGVYLAFGHNYDAVRIVQVLIFALTVILFYFLAEKLTGIKIAFWSSLAVAAFYAIANQAGNLTTESVFIFILMAFVWAIYRSGSRDFKWLLISGILLALAALTRSITQYLSFFIAANLFFLNIGKIPMRKIIIGAAVFLSAFILTIVPWFFSERISQNAGASISPRVGASLAARVERMDKIYSNYAGHFIGSLFGYYFSEKLGYKVIYDDFRHIPETDKRYEALLNSGKTGSEADAILARESEAKILKEPYKYFLVSVIDFINFNSPIIIRGELWQNTLTIHPMFAEGRHPGVPDWEKAAIILSIRFLWFAFLGLAIFAIIKNIRNYQKSGWIFLIIAYFNFAYSAVHAIPRYALPIYPFYILLAAIGLTIIFKKNNENLLSGGKYRF